MLLSTTLNKFNLTAELFVPLLLAVLVLLLHVLGEVEDGVKQESTQTTQQAPLLLVCVGETVR